MKYTDWVRRGATVRAFDGQGCVAGEGVVRAYIAEPTVMIVGPNGERFDWIASMCEEVTTPERTTVTVTIGDHTIEAGVVFGEPDDQLAAEMIRQVAAELDGQDAPTTNGE